MSLMGRRLIRSLVVWALLLGFIYLLPFSIKIPGGYFTLSLLLALLYFYLEPFLMDYWARVFENAEILTFVFDSRGLFLPIIARMKPNGKIEIDDLRGVKGEKIESVFEKEMLTHLLPPTEANVLVDDEGNIYFKLRKEDFIRARYSSAAKPVFLYNTLLGSFVTKDWLANAETASLNKLLALNIYEIAKDLHKNIKHFLRLVVDMLPASNTPFNIPKWLIWALRLLVIGVLVFVLIKSGALASVAPAVHAGKEATQVIMPR